MSPVQSMRAWLVLSAALLSGCFFQGDINERPVAAFDSPPGPLFVNDFVEFTAEDSVDPDGDGLRYTWSAHKCDEDGNCDGPRFASSRQLTFSIVLTNKEMIEVRLVVTDSFGAEDEARDRIVAVNRDPTATVDVGGFPAPITGDFTVGRELIFTATGSDPDDDSIAFDWTLIRPKQSPPDGATLEPIGDPKDGVSMQRLFPDVPGNWGVEVTISDGDGGTVVVSELVAVEPDAPPCLALTSPEAVAGAPYVLLTDAGPRTFSVLQVVDEFDPFPEPLSPQADDVGVARFRWQVARPGRDFETVAEGGAAALSIDPANYAPGDVVDVRVEVADRVARELPCSADQATCSILGDPTCVQRVTWKVEIR